MTNTLAKPGIAQDWAEVRPLLEKVICRIKTSQEPNDYFLSRKNLTLFDGIADAAGNHVFDDLYDVFKITEKEGHRIREHFQMYSPQDTSESVKKHVEEIKTFLVQHFPENSFQSKEIRKLITEKMMLDTVWQNKIKPLFEKFFQKIKDSEAARIRYTELAHEEALNLQNNRNKVVSIEGLANAAGNRIFKYHRDVFDIEENDGYIMTAHMANFGPSAVSVDPDLHRAHIEDVNLLINEYFPENA